jgi:diguanylate cyclase (GGDEF)-like protein
MMTSPKADYPSRRAIGMFRRSLSQNNLASFKVKLVLYFLLLALLPLAALFWGLTGVASRSEARLVDARLTAGLRAALGVYSEQLDGVARTAAQLARAPEFQASLAARDRLALLRVLQDDPELRVVAPGGFRVGLVPELGAQRVVRVVGPGGRLVGRVIASVPLDASLAETLRRRAGLDPADRVLVLSRDTVIGGPPELAGATGTWSASSQTLRLAGKRYRGLASGPLPEQRDAALAVVTPQATIDAANRSFQRRYVSGLLVSIALLGIVAALQGRALLRAISRLVVAANAIARGSLGERVPVRGRDELAVLGRAFNDMADQLQARLDELEGERERLRDAFTRLGEALAATHDPEQLMRVIVETAVDATGADGGILVSRSGDVVQIGDPEQGDQSLEVPLTAGSSMSFGTLILYGHGFSSEQRVTASSLGAQAVVALENARLHQIVERQASLDGLTGLANRRQSEDALAAELARAERLGGSVTMVLADLDSFKDVNDRYGHPAGDAVLREFAHVLRNSVREIDTAGRWGGEEFVVLLPGTDARGGAKLAERLRTDLESRPILAPNGTALRVTASFGVASTPPAAGAPDLVAAADAALYEAKRTGKNRVETAPEALRRP